MRRVMTAALGLLLVAMIAGSWSSARAQEPQTFRTPLGGEPPTLDPYFAVDISSALVVSLVYTPLVTYDDRGHLVPAGASRWDVSSNGLVYTMHLRRNLRFHSGRPVTAADWAWSFERMGDPSLSSPVADLVLPNIQGYDAYRKGSQHIAGIRVIDPYTLQFVLDPAHRGGFLNRLAYYAAVVLDKNVIDALGKGWYGTKDAGSGPFVFKEWVHNDHVTLVPDPHYYAGVPNLSRVELPIVTEATTQLSEYEAGQLDLILVPLSDFQRLQTDPRLSKQLVVVPRAQVIFLALNQRVYPPFRDARVRRAFAMAIDKARIAKTVFFGFFRPANSIVPPGIPGYYAEYHGLPYDPGQARRLLDDAGMAGHLPPLAIALNPLGPVAEMAGVPIAAMLKASLGVNATLQRTEFANFIQSMNKRTVYQAFITGWTADYLDYSDYLDLLLDSRSHLDRVNYSNPDFDKLVDEANAAPTEAQRIATYHRAEALAVNDAALVPLFFTQYAWLKKPYVQGLPTMPATGLFSLTHVSIRR